VPAGCPTLDFDVDAPDPSQIALTFDDGPEPAGTTAQVLDILKEEGVHATFFVTTNDSIDVLASSSARSTVQRMLADGHQVGDHTVHHYSLGLSSTDVEKEVSGVYDVLRSIAPGALAWRLVRAPYGEPFFGPQDRLDYVAPIIARQGVHVGWNIDSRDWSCGTSASCVKDNVLTLVDGGRSGIVLLHSTKPQTVAALRDLIVALRGRGKKFVMVEQLVVAKYGKPSRRLFRCVSSTECGTGDVCGSDGHCTPGSATSDAGVLDAAVSDTGKPDTGATDTAVRDTATGDTAIRDTEADDTGGSDTSTSELGVITLRADAFGEDAAAHSTEKLSAGAAEDASAGANGAETMIGTTGCGVGNSGRSGWWLALAAISVWARRRASRRASGPASRRHGPRRRTR